MCGFVSTSFFFVAMAVTDGIAQFLTRENLLLNSVHRKIQADPKENFRDEFRGENSLQKSREIRHWLSFAHALSVIIHVLLTLTSH